MSAPDKRYATKLIQDLVFIVGHAETPRHQFCSRLTSHQFSKSKIHFPSQVDHIFIFPKNIGTHGNDYLNARKMIIQTFHIEALIGDIILD